MEDRDDGGIGIYVIMVTLIAIAVVLYMAAAARLITIAFHM